MHTCAETWACCSDYKSVKAATGGKGQAHQQNANCDDGDEYRLHNRLRNTECRSSACFQAIVGDGQRSSSPESPREKVRNAAATRTAHTGQHTGAPASTVNFSSRKYSKLLFTPKIAIAHLGGCSSSSASATRCWRRRTCVQLHPPRNICVALCWMGGLQRGPDMVVMKNEDAWLVQEPAADGRCSCAC